MKRRITIIALLLISSLHLRSQPTDLPTHEFSLSLGGDFSNLLYKPAEGEKSNEFGFTFGFDYSYYFNSSFGIGTGIYSNRFDGKYQLERLDDSYQSNDGEGAFEYRYSISDFAEYQKVTMLQIPVMARFRSNFFQAGLGVKVGIPINARYENNLYRLSASGYYPEYDLTIREPAFMGFGNFYNIENKGSLKTKPVIFLSAEVCLRSYVTDKTLIYTGLFVDYGLNNAIKSGNDKPIDYRGDNNYKPNSISSSSVNGKPLADKMSLFTIGVKIGLTFGLN